MSLSCHCHVIVNVIVMSCLPNNFVTMRSSACSLCPINYDYLIIIKTTSHLWYSKGWKQQVRQPVLLYWDVRKQLS